MNVEDKDLEEVQRKLDSQGLRDVKFFFTGLHSKPHSEVTEKIALILRSHLAGFIKPAKPLADVNLKG